MEFLVDAVFSSSAQDLIGALILSFDDTDFTSRAEVKLYNTKELKSSYPKMKPRGFILEKSGVLKSDSNVTKTIRESIFEYMKENAFSTRELDMTDLVLFGLKNNAFVLLNPEDCLDKDDFLATSLVLPFKRLNVSKSSFNIYGSFKNKEGKYRTFSLLNHEDGSAKEVFSIFPISVDVISVFGNKVEKIREVEVNGNTMMIYKSKLGLSVFYSGVGSAFLNFLAYNVAFYDIGEKVLKSMISSTGLRQIKSLNLSEEKVYEYTKPKVNTYIVHTCKDEKIEGILQRINNPSDLSDYIKECHEAAITHEWLVKIYQSPWFTKADESVPENECMYNACENMLYSCRISRLKYAIELLMHRYYLYKIGVANDFLGPILRGGGVYGESVKRIGVR